MRNIYRSLLMVIARSTQRELARHVRYLKVENQILRSKLPARITITPQERSRLVRFAKNLGSALSKLATIVHPGTIRRWIRESKRGRRSPAKRGRRRTAEQIRRLVVKLARENGWGYTRVLGELRKLGVRAISRSTVKNILKENGLDPGPQRGAGTWDEFLKIHAATLWQCDFFSRKVLTASHFVAAEDAKSDPQTAPKDTESVRFDPVVKQIEGWTVHVDPQMLEGKHSENGTAALRMLASHLQRIAILVPEDRLAKKVHITHAGSLLSRQQLLKHPAVVLHELAHAYHEQFLGYDDPRIIEAYQKAKESGSYEKVLLYDGNRVRHYAMQNHKEYFAEATEAYFYRNDFYPFVRAELKEHDPDLYDLLVEIWGP